MNWRNISLLACCLGILLFAGCNNDDDEGMGGGCSGAGPYEGITMTDTLGHILSVDPDDWSPYGAWVGHEVYPDYLQLGFVCDSVGHTLTTTICLTNVTGNVVTVSDVDYDTLISVTPTSTTIQPHSLQVFSVSYTQTDTADHQGSVVFHNSSADPSVEVLWGAHLLQPGEPVPSQAVEALPTSFVLYPAYPNPTQGLVMIRFALPEASQVRILIKNPNGQVIATLTNGNLSAGNHSVDFDPGNLPAGIYRCEMGAMGGFCRYGDIQIE
jgi:hypothetical protein